MVNKLISKIKTKIKRNKDSNLLEEYKFSSEEIENLKEQNKQKIENLQNGTPKRKNVTFTSVSKKLNGILDETQNIEEQEEKKITNEIPIKESTNEVEQEPKLTEEEKINEVSVDKTQETEPTKLPTKDKKESKKENSEEKESYINLKPKTQELIMASWNEIDLQQVDKDIIEGKDLLNHNYNITYGDNAAKFVHSIRKRYEIVICYLIGFNNEKKGILNKTTFSDRVDDEWKYLNNYIKLLEKIRSFRK